MFKYDLPDFPVVPHRHVKGKSYFYFKGVAFQPVLAFHVPFAAMDMNRFLSLVGVKEETRNREMRSFFGFVFQKFKSI
jgi:hypothetical protein